MSGFEPLGGESKFTGRIITVSVERFRHDDGEEVSREKVAHPGAVGMIVKPFLAETLIKTVP